MKIQGGSNLLEGVLSGRPTQPASGARGSFGEVFQNTLNEAASAGSAAAPVGAGVAIRLQSAPPAPGPAVMPRVEKFLDLLDDYRRLLADCRVGLKGLDSAVQAVEIGRDELSPLLAGLPEGDGLRDVLNQSLVTAEIEILRFRRGDYLPT
jgi:hypothetical protein